MPWGCCLRAGTLLSSQLPLCLGVMFAAPLSSKVVSSDKQRAFISQLDHVALPAEQITSPALIAAAAPRTQHCVKKHFLSTSYAVLGFPYCSVDVESLACSIDVCADTSVVYVRLQRCFLGALIVSKISMCGHRGVGLQHKRRSADLDEPGRQPCTDDTAL